MRCLTALGMMRWTVQTRKVLQELNAAAGRSFKPDGRKVEYIRARLRELASELPN
jgi:hypothetical protein